MNFESFDAAYVERLTQGDPETERHFVSYFGELIRIKLRSRLRSTHLIEEAKQETFLRVLTTLRRKGGVEHPERLGAFVNSVCNNVFMETLRAESKTAPLPETDFDPKDPTADVEREFVTQERKNTVRQILAGIPDKHREILRLVFIEEQDKDEVCRRFNVEPDYLRVLIHRAKASFRTALGRHQAMTPGQL